VRFIGSSSFGEDHLEIILEVVWELFLNHLGSLANHFEIKLLSGGQMEPERPGEGGNRFLSSDPQFVRVAFMSLQSGELRALNNMKTHTNAWSPQ
jgi:hypothetical protein